jgi:DNA polymerase-3 subunit delta
MSAKRAAETSVSPLYLIVGKDSFLNAREARRLTEMLLSEEERPLALWQPSGEDSPPIAEVLDELRTVPFLAGRRVVLMQNAESFLTQNRALLEEYLEHPCPTGVLILTVGSADSRTRLVKRVRQLGGLIETDVKPWELTRFAAETCRAHFGKTLPMPAAQLLVELTGDEPGRIWQELEKLAVFAGDRKTITPELVQQLVGRSRTYGAFDVIESLMKKNIAEALQRLRMMFESDKTAEYTVIGAFAYHFRRLFGAKCLLEKGLSEAAAAKQVGVWEKTQGRFFEQVKSFSLKQLGGILAQLGEIDYLMKTGKTTAPAAMERLLVELGGGL